MWTYTKHEIDNLIRRSVVLFDSRMEPRAAANIIHVDSVVLKAKFMFDTVEFGE